MVNLRRLVALAALAALAAVASALPAAGGAQEIVGPGQSLTDSGRKLDPAGRMTTLGAFPTGGALTPDGRFYWAVDAGRGVNAVRVIDVASGAVRQTLPLPGGYVGIAFAPDGRRAYVSGQRAEGTQPQGAKGTEGDVVHVYDVQTGSGGATELDPIDLPDARDGQAADDELPPASNVNAWPEGLDLTPDGRHLVVALGQADQVAIVNLSAGTASLADVGRYPYGVVADPRRPRAYVTNERDGTVSVVEVPSGRLLDTIAVGGPRGSDYAHPQGLVADPASDRLYVAVTERDLIAVIDTDRRVVERYVDIGRPEGLGTGPVALALSPDGDTLYSANSGEDAVAAIAVSRRPPATAAIPRRVIRVRSVLSIRRFQARRTRARRARLVRLRRAEGSAQRRAVKRRYRRAVARLRERLYRGRAAQSCSGPLSRQASRYSRAVLRTAARRARGRRRVARSRRGNRRARLRRVERRYLRATGAARRRLPKLGCPPPGFLPSAPAFSVLGRLPTAAYPTDVAVTPDGGQLVWLAAKGLGTGPNPGDEDISRLLLGRAGVLPRPTDTEFAALSTRADRQIVPTNFKGPPPNTPVVGPGGGPSDKIKYVFYVVRENRTYDQIFGSDPRGRGNPAFQVFDDNDVPGPTGGVTPNVHELSRRFSLLDNVYANSEESTVGHKITAGGRVNDYTQRYVNTGRGRRGNPDIFPIGIPANGFIFDQAVRQGLPFRAYGELGAANQPFGDDGRPTFEGVVANTDPSYPSQVQGGCGPVSTPTPPNATRCTADSGEVTTLPGPGTSGPPATASRIRSFAGQFPQQVATGTVPRFNYFILFNDHTVGTSPGFPTPKAMVADNDLALGQLVELVSNSSIWDESAILVIEDDSQDGIDSVDAHRMPALVISPWAKRGGQAISTRFDQYSFLRTAELIVGLRPLHLTDALATPLYDAFISGDD